MNINYIRPGLLLSEHNTKMANAPSTQMQMDIVQRVHDDNALTEYEMLLCRLYTTNLFNAKSNGLEQMHRLHKAIGCPMDNLKIIHVAGSNGKGSTAVKIANSLQLANYRVGLFTSPHISSFRERIQINGTPVSQDQVVSNLRAIFEICDEQNIPSTFFEIVTALAVKIFSLENVDLVVLETGLGGRLDATNIVKRPLLSIITSIGLEHTHILGDTLEKIAMEKGGIIKDGSPVLVGNNLPQEVLRQCALDRNASAFCDCDNILGNASPDYIAKMDYDAENSRIAEAALTLLSRDPQFQGSRMTQQLIKEGVKIRPPCRFEEITVKTKEQSLTVILDVAHNPQALEQLFARTKTKYPMSKPRILVGMSADKDIEMCSNIILRFAENPSKVHLVEASNPRAASVASLLECNPMLQQAHYETSDSKDDSSIAIQMGKAIELASANNEFLLVCGSFFIMSEVRRCLGVDEPRDRDFVANIAGAKTAAK